LRPPEVQKYLFDIAEAWGVVEGNLEILQREVATLLNEQ
jgi:hypothetical protein